MEYTVRFQIGCETILVGQGVISDTRKYVFTKMKAKSHWHLVNNVKRKAKKNGYFGWKIYQDYEQDIIEHDKQTMPLA